jgi:carboxyl-terminal processing protease
MYNNTSARDKRQAASSSWVSRIVLAFLLALMLVAVGFGTGVGAMWFFGPSLRRTMSGISKSVSARADDESSPQEKADLLWEAWRILEREYIDPSALDATDAIHGAAEGLVESVDDPYTAFVRPLPAQIMDEDMQGSFEGIGATVEMVDGRLRIVRPLPGSPAEEAGLKPGDIVLEVDGVLLEGMDILEAISLIRGPQGTIVRLLIEREDIEEPFLVPVQRDKVELVTVESEMLAGDVAYIRLREFNAIAHRRLREALDTLVVDEESQAVILDLRGNPGGYLQMAVDVASEFLPRGDLILVEEQRGRDPEEYRVRRRGLAVDIPLVVLVDKGSASASEIVAGALQDNERATLIGERTFGKGSVQNTHELQDGSSLRVTIARWLLPGGAHLDGEGIEPDIEIIPTAEQIAADQDVQLDRALRYLQEGR